MALPHQVRVKIEYNGTTDRTETVVKTQGKTTVKAAEKKELQYTIIYGDTLWGLAKKYYGNGKHYDRIYQANKEVIESTAKAHGKPNSNNGNWIWPGEKLTIPEIYADSEEEAEEIVSEKKAAENNLGEKIENQITSFSYTDVASGQSDSVSITMQDIKKEWLGKWMPKKGASLGAKIELTNWREKQEVKALDCGRFVLDDISFTGRPLTCTIGGVSIPAMDDFKSLPRTQTWEKATLQKIATEVAKRAGISLVFDSADIQIAEMEQNRQTDSAFLSELCEKYGLGIKVYNHKIVIFDWVQYEAKKPVRTFQETDLISWDYNTTVNGTYTGAKLTYTNPDNKENKSISVTVGKTGRLYSMNTQAYGEYDAQLQAAAKVNGANREAETMTITIDADIRIVASSCIGVEGLGNASGKYFVDKIKHDIGNGYKMQLTMHKVQKDILDRSTADNESNESKSKETGSKGAYTVVSGDALWGIAKKYYGNGKYYDRIYKVNKEVIESTAKAHGKPNSNNGNWIWPGEKLTIPEV